LQLTSGLSEAFGRAGEISWKFRRSRPCEPLNPCYTLFPYKVWENFVPKSFCVADNSVASVVFDLIKNINHEALLRLLFMVGLKFISRESNNPEYLNS